MSDLFAAIDLGSNSFHLLLARRRGARFETVERLKEKVQLLAGFSRGELHPDAMARGQACLARFAQRLAAVPRAQIAMVGTHALREAANREAFATLAERILGVPLEVVSGQEEARLVNLGVAQQIPQRPGFHRLVVDIGGGSTELAWSDGNDSEGAPVRLASHPVGCVSLADAHFGPASDQVAAYQAAKAKAGTVLASLEPVGRGVEVIGTSGTVESIQGVLAANGWGEQCINAEGLRSLTEAVASGDWLVEAGLPGLAPERVDIFAAGLAVLDVLFERLQPGEMRFAEVSLQDGLIYRGVGLPALGTDPRDQAVADLQRRFSVDDAQARRVRATALALYDDLYGDASGGAAAGVDSDWACNLASSAVAGWRAMLGWAAELHEIGLSVASRQYHRHGGYLLQHSRAPAFSRSEQDQLALLVRGHRRGFPGLAFSAFDDHTRLVLTRLLALLRLAVILHRGHLDEPGGGTPSARARHDRLTLLLPEGWLTAHPLSAAELAVEREQLLRGGIHLELASLSARAARSAK